MAKAVPAIRTPHRDISCPDPLRAADGALSPGEHRSARVRFFATELAISLAMTLVMSAVATWFLSNAAQVSTGRFADALPDMISSTFGPIIGFVMPITLAVRRRVRDGAVRPMAGNPVRPRNVLLRTALLGVITSVLLGVPGAWVLASLAPQGVGFLLFKIGYGGLVALVVTPFVLIAALRDR